MLSACFPMLTSSLGFSGKVNFSVLLSFIVLFLYSFIYCTLKKFRTLISMMFLLLIRSKRENNYVQESISGVLFFLLSSFLNSIVRAT
jgi:TctA family transporter